VEVKERKELITSLSDDFYTGQMTFLPADPT
jgi:hypothetical protein